MKTSETLLFNMPWGQFDFTTCIIFCILMFLFMIIMCSLFYRRRRWSWIGYHAACWGSVKKEYAENILKNRLAKGEINEAEYDNLLRKIRS
jgi:uncharacterized membrane protein